MTANIADHSTLSNLWFYCLWAWVNTIDCHRHGGSTGQLECPHVDLSATPSASHCRKSCPASARQNYSSSCHRYRLFGYCQPHSISCGLVARRYCNSNRRPTNRRVDQQWLNRKRQEIKQCRRIS
jgi:hypothetical protein